MERNPNPYSYSQDLQAKESLQGTDSASKRTIVITEEEHEQFQLFLKIQQQQKLISSQTKAKLVKSQLQLEIGFGSPENILPDFDQVLINQNELQLQPLEPKPDQNSKDFQFEWELPRD